MPIAADVMLQSAALLNDPSQTVFTNTVLLPFLNMAMEDLQEIFEQNNIPVTNETSAVINVPANTSAIGFSTTIKLPPDLIEIQRIWERTENVDPFVPMTRKEFLNQSLSGQQIAQLLYWAWIDEQVRFNPSNGNNDIKLDYIKSIFTTILDPNEPIIPKNTTSYLRYQVAGFSAEFIGENKTRAMDLYALAVGSLDRSLGISIKGRQSISTRRRPFLASYKSRGF
jgi:hypothetical protein